jgi:hypothetical protein
LLYNASKRCPIEICNRQEIDTMTRNVTTISVLFDGEVLRPDTPPDLEPNTRYVAVIQVEDAKGDVESAWDVLEHFAGTIDAPDDWASEHDHYLYGTPKRNSQDSSNQA